MCRGSLALKAIAFVPLLVNVLEAFSGENEMDATGCRLSVYAFECCRMQ